MIIARYVMAFLYGLSMGLVVMGETYLGIYALTKNYGASVFLGAAAMMVVVALATPLMMIAHKGRVS